MSYRKTIHNALTWGTIGLNAVVFGKWNMHMPPRDPTTNKYYKPPHPVYTQSLTNHVRYMEDHYTLSQRNIDQGRWYTMLTSAFSHNNLVHLLFNMYVFKTAANIAGFIGMGPLRFVSLGVGSALGGSVGGLWYDAWRVRETGEREVPGLGASGMIQGMLVATMLAAPWVPMSIMFLPVEISYRTAVLGFLAWDMYNLHSEMKTGIRKDHKSILSLGNSTSPSDGRSHDTGNENSGFSGNSDTFSEFTSDDFRGNNSGNNIISDNTSGKNGDGGGKIFVGYAAHLGGAAFGALFYLLFLRKGMRRVVSITPPPNVSFAPRQSGARSQPVTKSPSSSSSSSPSRSGSSKNSNKASPSPRKLPNIKRRP